MVCRLLRARAVPTDGGHSQIFSFRAPIGPYLSARTAQSQESGSCALVSCASWAEHSALAGECASVSFIGRICDSDGEFCIGN
jgi:hypothetical protein